MRKTDEEIDRCHEHPLEVFKYCPRCGSSRWTVNNVKSKHCPDCGFTYYANPSSATAAFIVRDGVDGEHELLVVRRAKEPAKGTLDLPGGFVDMDEDDQQAILREIREETGLEMRSCRFLFTIPNVYHYSGMDIHTLDMFYFCQPQQGAEPVANDDADDCQWVKLSNLNPADFGLTSIRQAVERFLKNS